MHHVHLRYYNILSCVAGKYKVAVPICGKIVQTYSCVFSALTAVNFLEGIFIGFIYCAPHPTNRIKFVFITFLESREALLARSRFFPRVSLCQTENEK